MQMTVHRVLGQRAVINPQLQPPSSSPAPEAGVPRVHAPNSLSVPHIPGLGEWPNGTNQKPRVP